MSFEIIHFIAINDLNQNKTEVFKVRFSGINLNKIINGYDIFFLQKYFYHAEYQN